jgi:hypothetical protein
MTTDPSHCCTAFDEADVLNLTKDTFLDAWIYSKAAFYVNC